MPYAHSARTRGVCARRIAGALPKDESENIRAVDAQGLIFLHHGDFVVGERLAVRKDLADFAGMDGEARFEFEHAAGGRLAGDEARQKAEARAQDAVGGAVVERLEQPGGGQRMEFLHGPEGIVGDAGVGIGEAVFEVGNAVGAGECGGGGLCQGTWLHIPHRVTTQPGTGAPSRRGVRCARNRGFAPTVTGWSAF